MNRADLRSRIDAAAKRYATTRDPKAREEVATLIQPMLGMFAQKFVRGKPLEAEVALSSANLGLLDALEKYQPERGAKFVSFARHRIDGAMMDGVREEDPNARLSLNREKRNQLICDTFYKQNGRKPTPEELETLVNKPGEMTTPTMRAKPIPVDDTGRREFSDRTSPAAGPDLDDAFEYITRGLDRRERMAFTMYYRDGHEQPAIGSALGVSRTMVSKILAVIHQKLESRMDELAQAVGVA